MSAENSMLFWLSLGGKNINMPEIERALNIKPEDNRIIAPESLPESSDCPVFYRQIDWLLRLAEENEERLKGFEVDFSQSQIWLIYFYDKQCNMEFDADLLDRMGRLGLKLCVSCEKAGS